MKQFILNREPDKDGIIRLEDKDYRYLIRVRRLAAGEFFTALLPNGEKTTVQVLSADRGVLTGKCNTPENVIKSEENGVTPPIILFQALPKGDKMDLIVRQAAESGISSIIPFISRFSVAKTGSDGQKLARWERIIKEARQQSGSGTPTAIENPLTISGLFDYWEKIHLNTKQENGAVGLLFHHLPLGDGSSLEPQPSLSKIGDGSPLDNKSLHRYLNNIPAVVALVIGPEGGFSESEVSDFQTKGFKPVTIGENILRTETAALYFTAAVRIILLERNSWELKQAR